VTEYKASTGAIGDISTGSLYLVILSDEAYANSSYVFTWSSRVKFKE